MTSAALASLATAVTLLLPAAAGALTLSVSTGSPQDVSATGATMRASLTVSALATSVTWQYGTTSDYGLITTAVSPSVLSLSQDLTLPVTELAPDTIYHVRAVATSGLTTTYGRDVKFGTAKASSGKGSSGASDDAGSASGSPGSSASGTPTSSVPATTPAATSNKGSDKAKASDDGSGAAGSTLDGDDGTDGGATTAPGVATAHVTPVLGRTLGVATVAGTVVAIAPSGDTIYLSDAQAVPTGTIIDARAGTVELKSALDRNGATQTGRFWGGLFEVRQTASARGLTQLVLRGGSFAGCGATDARARARARARAAQASTKKKPPRALWGSDNHGRFETRGRGSVATVRGTRWLTEDTCAGTRTSVAAGAVAVRDLARGRTVVVAKGHSYLARLAP